MRTLATLTVLIIAATAIAVSPATWQHATEANFAEGEFDSTVVNSHGEIRLARKIDVLHPQSQAFRHSEPGAGLDKQSTRLVRSTGLKWTIPNARQRLPKRPHPS